MKEVAALINRPPRSKVSQEKDVGGGYRPAGRYHPSRSCVVANLPSLLRRTTSEIRVDEKAGSTGSAPCRAEPAVLPAVVVSSIFCVNDSVQLKLKMLLEKWKK